jgi:hypothetical protein
MVELPWWETHSPKTSIRLAESLLVTDSASAPLGRVQACETGCSKRSTKLEGKSAISLTD